MVFERKIVVGLEDRRATTILLLALVLRLGVACSVPTQTQSQEAPAADEYMTVKYVVSTTTFVTKGANKAMITYENESGGTEQAILNRGGTGGIAEKPFERVFRRRIGTHVYLSAQNGEAEGSVDVKIFLDDLLAQQAHSDAPYGIATASATVH